MSFLCGRNSLKEGKEKDQKKIIRECCKITDPNWIIVSPGVESMPSNPACKISGDEVHFFPLRTKGINYVQYCTGLLDKANFPDIKETVRKYTSGAGWYCSKVNLALASDTPMLKDYAKYIRDLKFCIGKYGKGYTGVLYRGVTLSDEEIEAFEKLGNDPFYIPSFTSASTKKRM